MAKFSADATLFGIDLSHLGATLGQRLQNLPLLQWMSKAIPATPTLLVAPPDGASTPTPPQYIYLRAESWQEPVAAEALSPTQPHLAQFTALLLPEESVLTRQLSLPPMSGMELANAVQLQALTFSPFAPEDLVYAYRNRPDEQGNQQVDMALVAKKTLENARQQSAKSYQLKSVPEIWLPTPNGPVLCPGWGEAPRLRHERHQRWRLYTSVAVLLLAVLALAATPALKLRQQALQAQAQTQALVAQTTEVAAQRQALMAQAQTLGAVPKQLAQQIDPLKMLATLTRILPDDTAIQSLTLQGQHLQVQGLSDNASRIQQSLSQEPGFHGVRLPSAITREGNSNKESFVLEADLDPATFALWEPAAPSPSDAPTAP